MNTDSAETLKGASEYLTGPRYIDLYAKTHALDIHQFRRTPENLRPHISEQLPKRAYDIAYDCILLALKFFEEEEADPDTDVVLQHAAQLLEKLYLNKPADTPQRTETLHTAALAYYLAGHYARAFVLMRGVSGSDGSPMNLIQSLFLRELPKIKNATLKVFSQEHFIDTLLASSVRRGEIDDLVAVSYALEGTIHRVFLFFYEYARTGIENLIERAIAFARIGLQLSIEQELFDWWRVFQCALALLREYHRNSLWVCLHPLIHDDTSQVVKQYIKAAFLRQPLPILELWRSQSHVVEYINDGKSYCLKMPTSSGKTRIAELAILKFLINTQEAPEKKCIFIAPYRALAVELEQSLSRSFEPLGVGVSQLYGSYDLNPAESLLVNDAKILIATPEKMDAFLRYNTEVAQQIGLIIVDEGHIIDPGERGLRYELFLHRFIRRYERNGVRMLFISAVMPNVEQFARWITGRDDNGVLASDWRASQLLFGIIRWDGTSGRIDYTYRDEEKVDQSFFITNYFSRFDPGELKAAKCGRRLFPGNKPRKGDLTAMAAIKTTSEGPTLVFTPQKDNVESVAEAIIEVVRLQEQINEHFQRPGRVLPICVDNKEKANKLARCIRYAEESTGENSIVVRALKCGFVIHYGNVPRSLRIHLEELIRDGILRLVVANTTLAQGVNLPVKTILIHSLYNWKKPLKPRDFWNLCGRAGRAMYETEGHVYLIADTSKSPDEYNRARALIENYVKEKHSEIIISAIRQLLENLVSAWHEVLPSVGPMDIAELCQLLTSDDERHWLSNDLQKKLRTLDAQLLALMEEQDVDIADPNSDITTTITELFKDSMLYMQLHTDMETDISETEAISLIVQRIEHISRVCKTRKRRNCYYRMALSIEGCSVIENVKEDLSEFLQRAQYFMDWSPEERASYIVKLCSDFLMLIDDIRLSSQYEEPPDCWPEILKQWLMGKNAAEMATSPALAGEWNDPMKISTLVDDLCEFRLPWGLNAISMFWKTSEVLIESLDEMLVAPPQVANYFASMLRFGVHDPVATVALALGLDNRQAALELSQLYSGSVDATSILIWLRNLDQEDIMMSTDNRILQNVLADFIEAVKLKRQFSFPLLRSPKFETLEVMAYLQEVDVEEGMVLLSEVEKNEIHFHTPEGDYLGPIISQDADLLRDLQRGTASATIIEVDRRGENMLLRLQIQ